MSERRSRPDVVAFDVNETLLDLARLRSALVEHGESGDVLTAVFARSLATTFAAVATGTWRPFRESFESALAQLTGLTAEQRSGVADRFMELSPHPDVDPALRRLSEAGVRAVTLTHGSPGVAEAGLQRGGLTALVERFLTSEAIRALKPAREVYLWGAGVCDVEPHRMALVAVHSWDVHGAQRAGLTGGWASREEHVPATVFDPPHVQGETLVEVVEGLLALPRA
jgi:2-haloacid dehalogenase